MTTTHIILFLLAALICYDITNNSDATHFYVNLYPFPLPSFPILQNHHLTILSTNFQDMDDFFDDLEFTYREATWMVCVEFF